MRLPVRRGWPGTAGDAGTAAAGVRVSAGSEVGGPEESEEVTGSVPLLEPRDGLPPVVETDAALAEVTSGWRRATDPSRSMPNGPPATATVSGPTWSSSAAPGAGTILIDPIACPDLSGIDAAVGDAEAVLHAASQDLPCLAEIGFRPRRLFDTELAGRLLGYPRVALGTLVEEVLGFHLEKGHSAADWSTRPLREELLRYAALDVEVLVELRDALAAELTAQGKTEWARQEFDAVLAARAAAAAGRPVAAHIRHPPGTVPARARRRARALDGQGPDRPGRRPVAAPGPARHRDRRSGQVVPCQPRAARQDHRFRRTSGAAAREGLAGRRGAGAS